LDVEANINDYIYPYSNPSYSNYGTLGLIQMPSARMLEEGTLAFSWSGNDPYLRGSILAYPFSGLKPRISIRMSIMPYTVEFHLLVEISHTKIKVLMLNF
jgi:hypothetical protein